MIRKVATSYMAISSYEDALRCLNSLQSSATTLRQWRQRGPSRHEPVDHKMKPIRKIQKILQQTGCDIDKLSIIHVAGTKGKGSTCMYVDTILNSLKQEGLYVTKTGLFTSPHIVEVRERIQIDGLPLTKESFTSYFAEVWAMLSDRTPDGEMGLSYFPFLTFLAFHIFMKEKVSIATLETGVGGEYDVTNVIKRPIAAGVTKIGIDHETKLGTTLPDIAWHKGGIFKQECPALTINQESTVLEVLQHRAASVGVGLEIVSVPLEISSLKLQPDLSYQYQNAALALALVSRAFNASSVEILKEPVKKALESATLRGRAQTITEGRVIWYIDVAHTSDSLRIATQWFLQQALKQCDNESMARVLIFNHQSERRDGKVLLNAISDTILRKQNFDYVIFCTNRVNQKECGSTDFVNNNMDMATVADLTLQNSFEEHWKAQKQAGEIHVMPDVLSSVSFVRTLGYTRVHTLITGHPYLVGAAISILE